MILLGTLAIVAIITCWIRARRSFNNRIFRPNTTPQDYFDYINDNEFTPLTSSEFAASLQERPPTYVESERIEQNDESGSAAVISPIPPPPQPHSLPSLTRLRVVQLENIASIADRSHASGDLESQHSVPEHNHSIAITTSDRESLVVTHDLIDIADESVDEMDEDPLYT